MMSGFSRKQIYKITKLKDGCVYETQLIKSIWLPLDVRTPEQERAIAKANGGDSLANTNDYHFGKDSPV